MLIDRPADNQNAFSLSLKAASYTMPDPLAEKFENVLSISVAGGRTSAEQSAVASATAAIDNTVGGNGPAPLPCDNGLVIEYLVYGGVVRGGREAVDENAFSVSAESAPYMTPDPEAKKFPSVLLFSGARGSANAEDGAAVSATAVTDNTVGGYGPAPLPGDDGLAIKYLAYGGAAGRMQIGHEAATVMIDNTVGGNGPAPSGDDGVVMEYRVRHGAPDACADVNAVRQANRYKDGGEIRERLVDGFQTLGGEQRIDAAGEWSDPHRPSAVLDRGQDAVLRWTIGEAHARFDQFKNDPERLARELTIFSKEKMHPAGWTENQADANYTIFRTQNAGRRILLGDYIRRAASGTGAGVCQHQAFLFKVMADDFGLEASLVHGVYSPRMAPAVRLPADALANHAWNNVHIDGNTYVFDSRHQRFAMADVEHNERKPMRLREGDTRVRKHAAAELNPGDVVPFGKYKGWVISVETSEESGKIVIRCDGQKFPTYDQFIISNPGRNLNIGERYNMIRFNGAPDLGWVFEGQTQDGRLSFRKKAAVRLEVFPHELLHDESNRSADAKEVKKPTPVQPLQEPEMVPFERGKIGAGAQVWYRGEEYTLAKYDRTTGKPILFRRGRGEDFISKYRELSESELKVKYEQTVIAGKNMWIDKDKHADIYMVSNVGGGKFLVVPDPQYVIWDEHLEPDSLKMRRQ
jgi:hypothetical protein